MPMKAVAREKVIAGITSEMEVAAVLGLVESKRQYSNRMHDDAEAAVAAAAAQKGRGHADFRDSEIVG